MPTDENARKDEPENQRQKPATTSFPLKPSGEVVVTHLDSPPPAGRSIHPRRPAPIVPDRPDLPPEEDDEDKQNS